MRDRDPRSDAELLLATHDDVEAFGVFYRRNVEWVLAFTARRLGSAELAADVTAEAFAAALLASGRYDPARGAANSWLYGIVANKLGSAAKRGAAERRARRRLAMEPVAVEPEDIAWIEALAAAEDGRRALGLLATLPGDQRSLITDRVIRGRPYETLAGERHVAEATVRKRVSRGLATLRDRWQEGDGEA
jgi:RNA polymerase sigma-70 factor (ECF subfamily)